MTYKCKFIFCGKSIINLDQIKQPELGILNFECCVGKWYRFIHNIINTIDLQKIVQT